MSDLTKRALEQSLKICFCKSRSIKSPSAISPMTAVSIA